MYLDIVDNDACTGVAAKHVTLTDSTIKISTPGYASEYDEPLLPHNTLCQWAVEAPEDMVRVTLHGCQHLSSTHQAQKGNPIRVPMHSNDNDNDNK